MRRRLSFLSLALISLSIVITLPQGPAIASPAIVDVKNESTNCAWVTVYDRGVLTRYTILGGHDRPRFFAPGDSKQYNHLGVWRFKVRAEVMPGRACSGSRIADLEFITAGNNDRLYIRGSNGKFSLVR